MKQNTHIEHIEDTFLSIGKEGLYSSIDQLFAMIEILENKETNYSLSVKYDGTPALVCGVHPTTNKWFVGTKSVFNKTNPKICYNIADIMYFYPDNINLAETLHIALHYLKELDIKNALQGDLMYINKNPQSSTLEGPKYNDKQLIAFTPNTITYGIDYYSDLGNKIMNSKLGIIFHTQYDSNWNASPNPNLANLNYTKNVWFRDASYTILNPLDVYDNKSRIYELYYAVGKLDAAVVNRFSTNGRIKTLTNLFFNYIIRQDIKIYNGLDIFLKLEDFIREWYWNDLDKTIKYESKLRKTDELKEIIHFLVVNNIQIIGLFNLWLNIVEFKHEFINLLNFVGDKSIQPYFKDDGILFEGSHEGYVLSNNNTGELTKWVNRREFSFRNFNNKKWED